MSQAITAYTTTDAIRAAIGLTDNEVTDAMLVDQNLALELESDLLAWIPDHAARYAAGMAPGAQETEKLESAIISLYAQWFCAAQAITVMTLSIPQMIADGKDEMRRFQNMDMEALMGRVIAKRDLYKGQLQDILGTADTSTFSVMASGVPVYDPVSGV